MLLDSLRVLKSRVEGTLFRYQPVTLDSQKLSQLKHLVVSHTPANLRDQTRSQITEKLLDVFDGQAKRLLFACILTCPWFTRAQHEVSAQARNNLLYVVFVGRDEQFFSLTTPHEKTLSETLDEVEIHCIDFMCISTLAIIIIIMLPPYFTSGVSLCL